VSRAVEATYWWRIPPARQVTYLADVDPALLAVGLDPLPRDAPAVVTFRSGPAGSYADQVAVMLGELERVAMALFPHWLPGAERIDGPRGLGVPAVRALAEKVAASSSNFGPFLADLAERSLRRVPGGGRSRFAAEVRAAGLARVIASAYGRDATTLLLEIPEGLSPADERGLASAAEWLVQHGRFTVWLAGAPPRTLDRIASVPVPLPAQLTDLVADVAAVPRTVVDPPARVTFPPLSGIPRGDSPAELALERALAPHDWARGRRWNHTFEPYILAKQYRLDLFWAAEGLVVEVDGDDHRRPLKFADDRRRDVQLQIHGYDVLRFTDAHVLSDVQLVIQEVRQLLGRRRASGFSPPDEMRNRVSR